MLLILFIIEKHLINYLIKLGNQPINIKVNGNDAMETFKEKRKTLLSKNGNVGIKSEIKI